MPLSMRPLKGQACASCGPARMSFEAHQRRIRALDAASQGKCIWMLARSMRADLYRLGGRTGMPSVCSAGAAAEESDAYRGTGELRHGCEA